MSPLLLILLLLLVFGAFGGPYWGAPWPQSYGFGGGGLLLVVIILLFFWR